MDILRKTNFWIYKKEKKKKNKSDIKKNSE